jgi:hypothetical protein
MRSKQSEQSLIQTLMHNARASGNRPLERLLADITVWHYQNKSTLARDNLASRQDFLEKSFWIMLELFALLVERNHELEAAKRGMSNLWLPREIGMNGDPTRFG